MTAVLKPRKGHHGEDGWESFQGLQRAELVSMGKIAENCFQFIMEKMSVPAIKAAL